MNTQKFKIIDRTDGDADTVSGTVIIHDTVGGEPSIIAYEGDIAEAIETIAGPLPEGYENLPAECATAWVRGNDQGKIDGYEAALGARIELFEDFLKENSGVWTAPGGRVVRDEPDWVYPDDLMTETPEQEQAQEEEETTMEMMKITNERNHITMTMPQYLFWETYGCWLDGQTKLDAKEIAKALCEDDRERARELLDKYDCVVEFYA